MSRKLILAVIPALAVLGLLASFFSEPNRSSDDLGLTEKNQLVEKQEQKDQLEASDSQAQVADHNHDHKSKNKTDLGSGQKAYPKNFDYKKETENLAKLKADYPRSDDELMEMVLQKNEFAGAKPHSAAELAQRQRGALKVEALKTLVEMNKDKALLKRKLLNVAESSKDPVIQRIARAALESHAKGRPFFSETTRALENLPIPE